MCIRITGVLVKTQKAGGGRAGTVLRMCCSNEFPGEADASGIWDHTLRTLLYSMGKGAPLLKKEREGLKGLKNETR